MSFTSVCLWDCVCILTSPFVIIPYMVKWSREGDRKRERQGKRETGREREGRRERERQGERGRVGGREREREKDEADES